MIFNLDRPCYNIALFSFTIGRSIISSVNDSCGSNGCFVISVWLTESECGCSVLVVIVLMAVSSVVKMSAQMYVVILYSVISVVSLTACLTV